MRNMLDIVLRKSSVTVDSFNEVLCYGLIEGASDFSDGGKSDFLTAELRMRVTYTKDGGKSDFLTAELRMRVTFTFV